MKAISASGLAACPARLTMLGLFCLLLLGGCASTQPVEDREPLSDGEEVQVGYGTADKDDVAGSVSTVRAEDAREEHPKSLAEMLRGRVAGVQVTEVAGGGIQVRIRGTRSFYSSNEPLYVLDGMIIQADANGALYGINPYDIDSITVLKDASATSTYGSRGANGVILIKTKRGG